MWRRTIATDGPSRVMLSDMLACFTGCRHRLVGRDGQLCNGSSCKAVFQEVTVFSVRQHPQSVLSIEADGSFHDTMVRGVESETAGQQPHSNDRTWGGPFGGPLSSSQGISAHGAHE